MNVTHLGGDVFRLRVEIKDASMVVDLTTRQLYDLIEDGLEALVAQLGAVEECPFCEPGETCPLTRMLESVCREAKSAHPEAP